MTATEHTEAQFKTVMAQCRELFVKKMHDYGTAWSIMRPSSLTDQLFIKAKRIRSIEMKGCNMVGESVVGEFVAIVNYAIMGVILLRRPAEQADSLLDEAEAIRQYDRVATDTLALMLRKNHDYDEAWRDMRVSSYTDLIMMKLYRTKQIEDHEGHTLVSEGIEANYLDMLNYAVFGLIKLSLENEE